MLAWNKEKFKGHSKKYRKIGGIHHRSENQQRIQRYQESILFGLSLRQMVFALLAIGVAVGAYFGLKPLIGAAEVGWVCMLAAFPFAMCGFFTYNGMPAERFLAARCIPLGDPLPANACISSTESVRGAFIGQQYNAGGADA